MTPKQNGAAPAPQPFRQLSDAVMRVASAKDKRESMARVQRCIQLVRAIEGSFTRTCQHVAYLMKLCAEVTGGTMQALTVSAPDGTAYRVEDSEGAAVLFLDPAAGRVLVLPSHVLPLVGIFQLEDGERRVIIGEQDAVSSDGAPPG